jgi:hypothetical protein
VVHWRQDKGREPPVRDIMRMAAEVVEAENEYNTAHPSQYGPTGKRLAEARDALVARVQHPKRGAKR